MADIYIINSETPKDIALELQQLDFRNDYIVLKSQTAKGLLLEIDTHKKDKQISIALKREMLLQGFWDKSSYSEDIKNFKEFIFQKTFEPNKLTNEEIEDLCLEFYENFIASNSRRLKGYLETPKVNIIEDLLWWFPSGVANGSLGYKQIFDNLMKKVKKDIPNSRWSFPFIDPLHINKYYGTLINRNHNLGGILHYGRENYCIYEIDFCDNKLNSENQKFWNWYQKTWDVLAIYYDKNTNTCHVIKKPDEWKIEDNYTKMYYRYGNNEKFFLGMIEVPKWLYTTPAEKLKPEYYFSLTNADVKAEFVKKIGINRLIEFGTVVDSYENYPDNEMWAKSEYKIIDMSDIKLAKVVSNTGRPLEFFEYAPYLNMKNQTTGEYHLEGLHPRCKTLYDAIKMRYNGLNIKDYDIKDVK